MSESVFLLFQPFEQFEIYPLFNISINTSKNSFFLIFFTNYLFYLILITLILLTPYLVNTNLHRFVVKKIQIKFLVDLLYLPFKLVPTKFQLVLERFYIFIFELIYQQVGLLGQQFVPLFFTLFSFILLANVIGLVPYSFTLTSHIMLTFTLSFSVFTGLTILAVIYQPNFFSLFIPKGVPAALIPFLFIIEIISYCSRTFSLAIRLFANMMSGHVLLFILTGFCAYLFNSFYGFFGKVIFLIPFTLIVAITGLEVAIAFLQAYVFCVLVSIYLTDVFSLGH